MAPGTVVATVLAMVLMWHDRPLRFRTDDDLRVQIARRVRALSSRHVGLRYDHRTGQQIRVYREMTPKAAALPCPAAQIGIDAHLLTPIEAVVDLLKDVAQGGRHGNAGTH